MMYRRLGDEEVCVTALTNSAWTLETNMHPCREIEGCRGLRARDPPPPRGILSIEIVCAEAMAGKVRCYCKYELY